MVEEIYLLIASFVPTLTAVVGIIATAVKIIKELRKDQVVKDQVAKVLNENKELKKEMRSLTKLINETIYRVKVTDDEDSK